MSDSYYDIIVVGTELTGLISAAMLAKKGYRVLVVGHGNRANAYDFEGHSFIRRPWLFQGFETSESIKKVFVELALSLEMHNRPKPFDPFFQVVLPDHRLDVVAKDSLAQREFEREFPEDLKEIDAFFKTIATCDQRLAEALATPQVLPPDGFLEQRTYKKLVNGLVGPHGQTVDPLASFPARHPFRNFILAPVLMSTACDIPPYAPLQMIRTTAHLRSGLFDIPGGIDGLKRVFIDKVKSNCGDYREKITVDHFVMKRGKLREIVLKNRREVIGCQAIVCNMDVKQFFQLIPQEDQKQRYHLKVLELQPSHLLYTINFALRPGTLPVGMGQHVFVVGDNQKPLEDDNLLLISVNPNGPPTHESGADVVSVTARLNTRVVRPTLDNISDHNERIIARVCDTIPFFRENIVGQSSAWITTDKRTGAPAVDTSEFIPVLGPPLDMTLQTSSVASRTAYKNVVLAGEHLHGGLGFEGAFLGSLSVVQFVSDMVNRKSLLNK